MLNLFFGIVACSIALFLCWYLGLKMIIRSTQDEGLKEEKGSQRAIELEEQEQFVYLN